MIDDRVDGNGCLPGLAVTDDQFALAAPNRNHRINGLDTCLNRCVHILPLHNAWCNAVDGAKACRGDRAFSIDWLAQRVDNPADHCVTHWYRSDPARTMHDHTFCNLGVFTHDNYTDAVFFQIKGRPHHPIGKLYQLLRLNIGQALHACDPITSFDHYTDIAYANLGFKVLNLSL